MHYYKNTVTHYGLVAIFLHWLLAIIILMQIFLGWYMTEFDLGPDRMPLYGIHKQMGLFILMLATVRLSWRSINIAPSMQDLSLFEKIASRGMHGTLYFLMFAVPISGWAMSSAKGYPVSFLGLFVLPDLVSPDQELGHFLKKIHEWLAYGWLALIALHAAAALKHHFINKDNILKRMLF
jgi:cytochrome b561